MNERFFFSFYFCFQSCCRPLKSCSCQWFMDRRLSNAAPGCVGFYPLMLLSSQLLKEEQIGGLLVAVWVGKQCCLHAWLLRGGKPFAFYSAVDVRDVLKYSWSLQWDNSNIFITSQYGLVTGSLEYGEGKLICVSYVWSQSESESVGTCSFLSMTKSISQLLLHLPQGYSFNAFGT